MKTFARLERADKKSMMI